MNKSYMPMNTSNINKTNRFYSKETINSTINNILSKYKPKIIVKHGIFEGIKLYRR